jgi:hypothetical protein
MPLFIPDASPLPDPSQKAQHFVPPTVRERRAQAVHRMQVGLFGLAGMLLLVGLANIIMDRAMISDDATAASAAAAVAAAKVSPEAAQSPANDPLADIGVVPDMPAAESPGPVAPSGAPGGRLQGR